MGRRKKQKKTKSQMKAFFYYHREKNSGKPVVTVCLAVWRSVICRGMSLCSPLDELSKVDGRNKAKGYAMQAYFHRKDGKELFRPEALKIIASTDAPIFASRSMFKPRLTSYERKMLKHARVAVQY